MFRKHAAIGLRLAGVTLLALVPVFMAGCYDEEGGASAVDMIEGASAVAGLADFLN